MSQAAHPEKHPDTDTEIAQGVPRGISDSPLFNIAIGSEKLSQPKKLDDLLRSEKSTNKVSVGGKATRVHFVNSLHVGLSEVESILLTEEIEAVRLLSACQNYQWARRPYMKETGAMTLAVESETPIFASGAVG